MTALAVSNVYCLEDNLCAIYASDLVDPIEVKYVNVNIVHITNFVTCFWKECGFIYRNINENPVSIGKIAKIF